MNGQALKALVESSGKVAVTRKLLALLEAKKIKVEDFSLRELWEAFVGPCSTTLQHFAQANKMGFVGLQEAAVDSTAFPVITGTLISKKVIEGYNTPGYIGNQLVTNMPSKYKSETIAGFGSVEVLKEVKEGMPYEDSGLGEKYVTTKTSKKGRIISLTEEMIFFDQTGQIMERAKRLGERAILDKEETILNGALGIVQCYRPSGTATDLYDSSNAWEYLASNTLVDWTDIDNVLQAHAANAVDEEGKTIIMNPRILVTSFEKSQVARRIVSATEVKHIPSRGADGHDVIWANPYGGQFATLTSPLIYTLQIAAGTSAADSKDNWWLGDFTRQFFWQEIWPIQTMMAKVGHEDEFNRDITFKYKVRHYGGIFAVDNKYVIKSMN